MLEYSLPSSDMRKFKLNVTYKQWRRDRDADNILCISDFDDLFSDFDDLFDDDDLI